LRADLPFHIAAKLSAGLKPGATPILAAGVVAAGVVLLVGFVLVYEVAYSGRVYPGIRALGHDLGGYSREEARAVLQRSLDELEQRQLTLGYAEHSWTLAARELGLKTDVAPILASIMSVGREGHVLQRFATQFGLLRQGRSFEQPSEAFDPAAQAALLQRLAQQIDRPVMEVSVGVKPDFSVEARAPQSGRKLDLEATRRRLQDTLSARAASSADLVVAETPPKSADGDIVLARDQASRLVSAPVVLKHDNKTWTLERAQLASILRYNFEPGAREAAYLDRPALEAWAKTLAEVVYQTPRDARFAWAGGRLDVIRPSRDGVELDLAATVEAIIGAARSEQREMPLAVKVTRPATPMDDRQSLGIKQLLESARTPFAGSVAAKQENIGLASRRLNGVVVPPGGTFSFNQELGSTSLEAGFMIGFGITTAGGNIKTVPSVAGGICQVATTLFHTVFWSGYPIEERNWHLYWIPTYTSKGVIGLDATVDEEAKLDFKFINPTPHHLLIQSWVDEGLNINFALYGTKPDWTVKVEPSVKTDVVPTDDSTIMIEEEPTMPEGSRVQVERATEGFVLTNVRRVTAGSDERTLRLVSRYRPSRNVVLVGTGGRPATGQTIVEQNKPAPAEEKPTPTPAPVSGPSSATATPAPTRAPAATATPSRPTPTPTPRRR
jgi:vancomycin resistance protein YoaR